MTSIRSELTDGVAVVTLSAPQRRNAFDLDMCREAAAVFDRLEADGSVHAVVITGEGSAFCAGADLSHLGASHREGLLAIYEGFLRVARCPLPTIAAVNGPAVGAGMNLALGCDVRIVADEAKLDTRFLQIGIHPGGGHTWMLRRIAGPQVAMATVVFGQVLDGREAERIGLAYKSVPGDSLLEVAHEFAARAASAPRALAIETKKTIQAMADIGEHPAAVARELDPQLWSTRQPWFAERIAALRRKISSR